MDFYVYIHRKKTTKEVFYVGKGTGSRAFNTQKRSNFWKKIYSKHGLIVEFVEKGLQEWYAFELEQQLVDYYGRKNLGQGSLVNLCDGGGSTMNFSAEAKKRMSDSKRGKKFSPESRLKMSMFHRGKKLSEETKRKLSLALRGRPRSQKSIDLTAEHKSKPIVRSDGKIFKSASEASLYLREKEMKYKAHQANISRALTGKLNKAYGYKWEFVK